MNPDTIVALEKAKAGASSLKTIDKLANTLNVETGSLLGAQVRARMGPHIPIEAVLARNVTSARDSMKWSQQALSEASGVGREHIAHIERAEQNPSIDTIARLSMALQTSVESLLEQ